MRVGGTGYRVRGAGCRGVKKGIREWELGREREGTRGFRSARVRVGAEWEQSGSRVGFINIKVINEHLCQ